MSSWLTILKLKLRSIFKSDEKESELDKEMRFHLENLIEENLRHGMGPKEARNEALKEFGGMEKYKEECRDSWGTRVVMDLIRNVCYAARTLAKSPSFTIPAVLTLALGIGVNAALFSLYNMVALRPLPVKDPDSLVLIAGHNSYGSLLTKFSYAEYLAYRDEGSHTLDGLLALTGAMWSFQSEIRTERDLAFGGTGAGVDKVPVELVSENYFSMLGGALQLGRAFLPEEVRSPGSAPVIVLSHAFWKYHFSSDPNVIGTTFILDGRRVTVIGVAVAKFSGHDAVSPAGWLPLTLWSSLPADYEPGGPQAFGLIGRLKPGMTEAQATARLDVIASRRAAEFPGETAKISVELKRGLRFMNIPLTPKTLAIFSPLLLGFGMVLVIACTNVANLLLARGVSRQPEIGVRLTLGASRGQIIRQLLTENVLLCLFGAVVGLALGTWVLQVIQPIILAPVMPTTWLISLKPIPDLRVLGFTALLTVGASLVAGLLPALHTAGASLIATVRNQSTAFGGRLTPSRLRQLLVIVQMTVCVMLLSCAGGLARNFLAPQKVDRGFDPDEVFGVAVSPNPAITDRNAALRQALETVRAIPGVAASGVVSPPPFEVINGMRTRIRGVEITTRKTEQEVSTAFITGGFFDTFGVPFLRGRAFRELEQHSASRAIIVSESLARQLWPGQEALGKTLAVSEAPWVSREGTEAAEAFRECEVIGVARDVMLQHSDDNHPQLYLPFPLDTAVQAFVYVRPHSDSAAALAEIVRAAEIGGIGLKFGHPQSDWLEQAEQLTNGFAVLSGTLGALALVLASVGLYGLMSFTVNQLESEIGIRMALGATAGKVVEFFVRQGMRLVMIGLVLGLVGGGLFALLLEKVLFGILDAFDPVAFGAVTLLFTVIALFACWLPARRATKVDPMVALRAE